MMVWVSCSKEVNETVAEYRHLINYGLPTTLCGSTASHTDVWRRNSVKPVCPTCEKEEADLRQMLGKLEPIAP